MMIKCKDCRFWKNTIGEGGECHRNPPRMRPRNPSFSDFKSMWPHTKRNDECGDGEVEA